MYRLIVVLCSNRFLYLCPIQVSCSSTPRFFVFMDAPGAPSPATLSRPMPDKSRRKSAAPTPRSRGDPAPVVRSPGAHGSRQLLRCPRWPTKRCGCVHSFFLGQNAGYVYHWICYFIVPYIPGRQGIPSERTGPISAHDTPHPARRRKRCGARQMCTAAAVYGSSCCCTAAAVATAAATAATAERM